jgi:hypothetical protein
LTQTLRLHLRPSRVVRRSVGVVHLPGANPYLLHLRSKKLSALTERGGPLMIPSLRNRPECMRWLMRNKIPASNGFPKFSRINRL